MPKPGDKQNKPAEIKRISDYVNVAGGERLEGDKVDLEGILGDDIVLCDFNVIESTKFATPEKPKSEFAVIQFKKPGTEKLLTTSCGGAVVVRALKEMPKSYLPVMIRITKQKNASGSGKYYVLE